MAWVLSAGLPRRWAVDRRQADGERDERARGAKEDRHHRDEQPAEQNLPGGVPQAAGSAARRASRTTTVALTVRGCRNGDGCPKSIIATASITIRLRASTVLYPEVVLAVDRNVVLAVDLDQIERLRHDV